MTTLTIKVRYTLSELKEKYRSFFSYPKTFKVTKKDLASWLGNLAETDIQ